MMSSCVLVSDGRNTAAPSVELDVSLKDYVAGQTRAVCTSTEARRLYENAARVRYSLCTMSLQL